MKQLLGDISVPTPGVPEATRRRRLPPGTNLWLNHLYLLPILVFIVIFFYIGIGYTVYVSSLKWNGFGTSRLFVGWQNYQQISRDPIFYLALRNTAIFGIVSILLQMGLGFLIAVLMQFGVHGRPIYKVIFFLPGVTASAVTAYIFRSVFNGDDGAVNQILSAVGLGQFAHAWLADPNTALYALALINVWLGTSFCFIMYYASLTLIDEQLYEAAKLDGATTAQVLWHITLPLLRPTHFSLAILGVIGALKTFDIVMLVTGGGPGRSTEFLTTYIFKKMILDFSAGYASALSILLLLLALVFTALQLRSYDTREGAR